ncbi:MAG: helix-turn-helix transcriptional regulator, partial [bacterium]
GLVSRDAYYGMPELLMTEYNTGEILQCPRMKAARDHPERIFVYDYQHIDERGIDHSDYYHWLQSHGDGIRYYLGLRLDRNAANFCGISLAFRRSEGHCQGEHIERLQRIAPHLRRAVQIARDLSGAAFSNQVFTSALERATVGVIVLDETGAILQVNSVAEGFARTGGWLRLYGQRIELTDIASNEAFQLQVAKCRVLALKRGHSLSHSVDVIGPDLARYRLSPAPLVAQRDSLAGTRPCVIVTIACVAVPHARDRIPLELLTSAETALVESLAKGVTLARYARERSISVHTVRTQIKSVFQKTGTHRQAELVSLVLRQITQS